MAYEQIDRRSVGVAPENLYFLQESARLLKELKNKAFNPEKKDTKGAQGK